MSRAWAVWSEKCFRGGALTHEAVVLNPDVGRHIEGCGNTIVVVKADGIRPVFDLPLPVRIVFAGCFAIRRGEIHAQVPLADHAGVVAVVLQHGGNRLTTRLDQVWRKAIKHTRLLLAAPVVTPGEHAVTGGSAHCGRAVRVHKLHALPGQAVHVRGLDLAAVATVGLHIPQSPVICENENHIGLRRACTSFGRPRACTLVVRPLLLRGGLALRALGRRSLKRAQRSEKQKRYGEAIEFHFFSLFAAVGRMGV